MSRQRSDEIIRNSKFVTIGELVRLTGMRYSTIKYYTEEGFIPYEQEDKRLTRRYDREKTIKILYKIKHLREDGFTIDQIKKMLY